MAREAVVCVTADGNRWLLGLLVVNGTFLFPVQGVNTTRPAELCAFERLYCEADVFVAAYRYIDDEMSARLR